MTHPSGFPEGQSEQLCQTCAWARPVPAGLRCAAGSPTPFQVLTPACRFHQPLPACADCGACCREAFDAVPVETSDVRTLQRLRAFIEVQGSWRSLARVPGCGGTRCFALEGGAGAPYTCRVYADRPAACRDLAVGSDNCLLARRRVGLGPPAPDYSS